MERCGRILHHYVGPGGFGMNKSFFFSNPNILIPSRLERSNQDMAASAYREPSAALIVLCGLFIFGALHYLLDFPFFSRSFLAWLAGSHHKGCAQEINTPEALKTGLPVESQKNGQHEE